MVLRLSSFASQGHEVPELLKQRPFYYPMPELWASLSAKNGLVQHSAEPCLHFRTACLDLAV